MSVLFKLSISLPYTVVARTIWWGVRQSWVQRWICPQATELYRRLATEVRCRVDPEEVIRRGLAVARGDWRVVALGRTRPSKRARWVSIRGEAILRRSLERGKGVVVVNNHYPMASLVLVLLQEMGIRDLVGIRSQRPLVRMMGLKRPDLVVPYDADALTPDETIKLMAMSRQALLKGGVVHMAGDGCRGVGRVPFVYHGKRVSFRTGFAELAVTTGADVVPVFATLEPSGKVTVDFLEPLTYDGTGLRQEDAVQQLVNRYAGLLAERWGREPWNTNQYQLRKFFAWEPALPQE